MAEGKVVIAPFHQPWEWSADYPNQTVYILSKTTIVACYLWADKVSLKDCIKKGKVPPLFKKHSENLYLYTPLHLIPLRTVVHIEKLNSNINFLIFKLIILYLKLKFKTSGLILWNFYPIPEFLKNPFGEKCRTIYDCADFFAGNTENRNEKNKILENEEHLTTKADLVVANSIVLQKHLQKFRKEVFLVPQGFRIQDFENTENYSSPKIKAKKPIIGFAGAVNHRIDYDLLLPLAKRNPKWNFVIWGPVLDKERVTPKIWAKMAELLELPNVSTGFLKDRRKLPGIFKQFDIAMIPYDITQAFNKYCYPMKLFEFFYLGKPVVSTEVEELKRFPKLVKIGRDYRQWEKIIKNILSKPWPKKNQNEEKKLAIENSWENKVKKIVHHLYLH